MYQEYWHLDSKPFEPSADDAFFWPGENHQAALLKLRYAVENRRGAALLAGGSGLGKTALIRKLLASLADSFGPRVHLVFPEFSSADLLAYLVDRLSGRSTTGVATPSARESVCQLENLLTENSQADRHAVVVIDEAHTLIDTESLDTLRLLMNLEAGGQPAWTLLLVGQTALLPALDRMPELEDRISVKCLLRPLTGEETSAYVRHRLDAAGARQAIFSDDALLAIHRATAGVPRRINRLCDLALLIGYAEELSQIDATQIAGVNEELVTVRPD